MQRKRLQEDLEKKYQDDLYSEVMKVKKEHKNKLETLSKDFNSLAITTKQMNYIINSVVSDFF